MDTRELCGAPVAPRPRMSRRGQRRMYRGSGRVLKRILRDIFAWRDTHWRRLNRNEARMVRGAVRINTALRLKSRESDPVFEERCRRLLRAIERGTYDEA